MSTVDRRVRGVCTGCRNRVYIVPLHLSYFRRSTRSSDWVHVNALICAACRAFLEHFLDLKVSVAVESSRDTLAVRRHASESRGGQIAVSPIPQKGCAI